MNAIDTNILIYCHDSRDPEKQRISQHLLETVAPIVLLWQVGCEFIAAARKIEAAGFTIDDAWDALSDMCGLAHKIVLPVPETWQISRKLQKQHHLHFWDSLIIASCIQGDVDNLYSEDFGDNRKIGEVNIINPFHR
jgi:predicted nucleic acid-binding protein